MSLLYRTLLRPAVFLQDSERAHSRVLAVLSKISRTRFSLSMLGALYRSPDLPINVFDIRKYKMIAVIIPTKIIIILYLEYIIPNGSEKLEFNSLGISK